MSNPLLEAALRYLDMGLSIIPIIPGEKKPLIKWEPFQERKADKKTIISWWSNDPKANIGIVTGPISGIAVVDIDTDEGKENILQYIPDSIVTPTTKTPGGGNHLFFIYPDNFDIGNNARLIPGCDFRGKGGYVLVPPSSNGTGIKYEWLIEFSRDSLMPLPDAYINKINNSTYSSSRGTSLQGIQSLQFLQKGQRDSDLFHIFNCLAKGGYERELADKLSMILSPLCNPPFPEKEALEKVNSAYLRSERKEENITQKCKDLVLGARSLQHPYIYLTEAYTSLQFLQASQKAAAQVAFHRMCQGEERLLEKTGKGVFRVLLPEADDIDIWDDQGEPFNIQYPMGIHDLIYTHEKNIIIVAGEPNAGKTAYLLNIAMLNMNKGKDIYYFSSEMGAMELRTRLKKFPIPFSMWKAVHWKDRAQNFSEVIRPDAINLIDYLEIYKDFYEIGLYIKGIFDALRKGIAIIAIQKPKGRDEGAGGLKSLEKARLALAMEPGKIKIVKAKNWRNDQINPNGMCKWWKLVSGCEFIVEKRDGEVKWIKD